MSSFRQSVLLCLLHCTSILIIINSRKIINTVFNKHRAVERKGDVFWRTNCILWTLWRFANIIKLERTV